MFGRNGDTPSRHVPHGFADDERSRLLGARPPAQALAWVEASLGARIARVQRLRGGSSSAVHAVRVAAERGAYWAVLRRYVLPEVNAEEPDIAAREARILRLVRNAPTPTPRLIAVDPTGIDAGVPTLLMTRVAGRVDWWPKDIDVWLRRLIEVLPGLHALSVPAAQTIDDFAPYEPASRARPEWMRHPELWERALAVFDGAPGDAERVFIHRDFHPGNVLWRRGRVAGVVDWQAASMGPSSVDVAWCRINLLGRFGAPIADRCITTWESISERRYHPWSEIVLLVDAIGSGVHERRARDDLERALAQRLSELGA